VNNSEALHFPLCLGFEHVFDSANGFMSLDGVDESDRAPGPRANGPSAAAVASMTEVEVVALEPQMRMSRAAAPDGVDRQNKSSSSTPNANAGVAAEVPPLDADKGVDGCSVSRR